MFGAATFERPWFAGARSRWSWPSASCGRRSSSSRSWARRSSPFTIATSRPEGATLRESNDNLDRIVERIEAEMERTGVELLWGTANLFGHPRYAAGAATNPDPEVFAYAAAQVRKALESTHRLGGANYVLWGGREGYETLLNTDLRRESEQLGRFMHLVVEHKHRIGFRGTILIEPKPMEPTKHQYDFDAAAVHAFLRRYGLEKEIKLNIEANHATLAGHSFQHEIAYAIANDLFGSVDINRGDPLLGWDTDQFPNDPLEMALALYTILRGGGFATGGFNFDAKLRRQSIDASDLFHAHVGGIDALARGLLGAARLIEEGELAAHVEQRYAGWQGELGKRILDGQCSLADLSDHVLAGGVEPHRARAARRCWRT